MQHFDHALDVVRALAPDEPVMALRPHAATQAARRFVAGFPGTPMYAVKCNDDTEILKALWAGGIRDFDTASLGEVTAVKAVLPEARCHFMHPVKTPRAIRTACHQFGVTTFSLDTEEELAKILGQAGAPDRLDLLVRITAQAGLATQDLVGKFGVDGAEAVALLRAVRDSGARPGITFHVGSQCLDPAAFGLMIGRAAEVCDRAGVRPAVIDVGGGFPAPYANASPPADALYFQTICQALADHGLDGADIYGEPGRALVAGAAGLIVQVVLRRGLDLHLNDGVYGAMNEFVYGGIDLPVRALAADRTLSDRTAGFRFLGPTCDSHDIMDGPYALAEDIATGDWIEIGQAGAYSAVLRTGFNGCHGGPVVLLADPPMLGGDVTPPLAA